MQLEGRWQLWRCEDFSRLRFRIACSWERAVGFLSGKTFIVCLIAVGSMNPQWPPALLIPKLLPCAGYKRIINRPSLGISIYVDCRLLFGMDFLGASGAGLWCLILKVPY